MQGCSRDIPERSRNVAPKGFTNVSEILRRLQRRSGLFQRVPGGFRNTPKVFPSWCISGSGFQGCFMGFQGASNVNHGVREAFLEF